MKPIIPMVAVLLLFSSISIASSDKIAGVEVLIELPDGRVFWGSGVDSYVNITERICRENKLHYKIGENEAIIDGYHLELYHWDGGWKKGEGKIIAWSDGLPVATPEDRYPRFSQSAQISYYSGGNEEVWNYSVGTGYRDAIDDTAVGFSGAVFFESWNGFYALAENGTLLWKNASIRGISTPYIYNNTLYVGAADGFIYAISRDGSVVFKRKISDSPGYTGISSSPVVVNGTIYIGGYESDNRTSKLYAMTLNGSEMWNVTLNSTMYFSSVAYHNGTVYVPLAGRYNSSNGRWYPDFGIVAVRNGSILWKYLTDGPVKSTPLFHNDSLYFTSTDGYLYCLDLNGNLEWKLKIGYSTSSPNAWAGKIFVGAGNFAQGGKIYAVSEAGRVIWYRDVEGGVQSSITVAEPFLIFSSNSQHGRVYCLDMNGIEVWNFTTSNYLLSTPSIVNRSIYFGDDSGTFHRLTDSESPEIEFYAPNSSRFGERVEVKVSAEDNVGVRKLMVFCNNTTLESRDAVNLSFVADFVGEMLIRAVAEDYNGNVVEERYSLHIYNQSMKLLLDCPETMGYGTSENCTVRVEDGAGNLVDGANLDVYVDGNLTASGKTNHGFYSFTLHLKEGNHTIRISSSKYGYDKVEIYRNVHVSREKKGNNVSFLWPVVILMGLLLISGLVYGYMLRKRQEKYEEIHRERMKNER